MVVNKGNRCILLRGAVDGHARCAIADLPAQNGDVVDRFPIPVVHREALPIRREERCETQSIHRKLSPRRDSTISRYIQPAEPVYHVHPPRPVCGESA